MKKNYSQLDIAKMATAFGKHVVTIERWIAKNDPRLTSDIAKKALKQKR